ncbi:hypothetical protein [Microbacterium sp. Leaf179]|uniref:hypothetical protein n=1 Tax=Microbacterium sp. Leaf179 TaxID=1736288 RepID=UPI0006F349BC|nr:hypothetical protein [Microbacterium sp. Leaf179]KQR89067.1 hypothetical protein ASF96_04825 [Microbacterium sp. Leaf179]
MSEPSGLTTRTRLIASGTAIAMISGAVVVLYFFQPWRSCEYEDTSAGCSMLPNDAAAMGVAVLVFVVGIVVLAAGLLMRRVPT